ncbi:YitT family protein [Paenibacillus sp. S150]|uniref:YitT family protein n=1 Tax=Paenibacillus sp. S150 TaxID=2749826 RepID=UPI001C5A576A|nr:YitT family protein [Paenibacillus sp. S150]MBW4083987.1 YitT family protein [Paenibacillus sp. S150]
MNTILRSGDLPRGRKALRIIGVIAGGLLCAVGLELFLMPHKLVPGGIAGLSALFAHVTEMRLGLFLFLFNLPFILISRRQIHLRFALYVMLGLVCLTAGSLALHHYPSLTGEPLTASIAGGLSLGFGIGISIRFGGMSGGAGDPGYAFLGRGPTKSAEIVIMVLNCAILLFGGALFGWDQAMYSIIAYLLAFEAVRISLRDLARTRAVWITSTRPEEIRRVLRHKLEREAKLVSAPGPQGQPGTLFCIASKLEEEELTSLVRSCDQDSEIVFRTVNRSRLAAIFRD